MKWKEGKTFATKKLGGWGNGSLAKAVATRIEKEKWSGKR